MKVLMILSILLVLNANNYTQLDKTKSIIKKIIKTCSLNKDIKSWIKSDKIKSKFICKEVNKSQKYSAKIKYKDTGAVYFNYNISGEDEDGDYYSSEYMFILYFNDNVDTPKIIDFGIAG